MSNKTEILGPFARIEGDLEVKLETNKNKVVKAYITAPMFRGFEQMLLGHAALDALVIAPRICGICSVAQSMAARAALANLSGITVPPNAQLVFNLMQAIENLSDHLAHFYLYFMPEFAHEFWANKPWHKHAQENYQTGGQIWRQGLNTRAQILEMLSPLAGKWPHSINLLPGGTAKQISTNEVYHLQDQLHKIKTFMETQTLGSPLAEFLALPDVNSLLNWAKAHPHADLAWFLTRAQEEDLLPLAPVTNPMLSFGAYGGLWPAGVYGQCISNLDTQSITEDLSSSWLNGPVEPLHPTQGLTTPNPNKAEAYSFNKAPRYQGAPAAVGALSRQMMAQQPLVLSAHQNWGQALGSRVLARWVEAAQLVSWLEQWLQEIDPQKSFCHPASPITQGTGMGLVEAARGGLGHFIEVAEGRFTRYQIIAPTSWNFSPRDTNGTPGPCESALEGMNYNPKAPSPHLWMAIRSFDPCMQCTVH